MRIGWIGTGVMGRSMAGHLLAAGHSLTIYNRTKEKAGTLLQAGATWADAPAVVAEKSEIIFTMVGLPSDLEEVYLGPKGIFSSVKSGTVGVDMTTSSPALAQRLALEGAQHGVQVLDAPVTGGDVGARNATLSIMVGGDLPTFERVKPLLEKLGKTILHHGPAGAGQHAKMVNQILITGIMLSLSEGLMYARRAGLDLEKLLQSVSGGAASSWALLNLMPRVLKGDLEPGFYVEHFIKDMGIITAEAERMKLALPGTALVKQLYHAVLACGGAGKGTQALILALEALNGERKSASS
ncbi:MAG: NAD(P)-dependent oxidoreductase [Terriglobia bacterium]